MQSLSLLSGGEQALAALAIIFAVFFNPAPICVLDEVDAPLDDSMWHDSHIASQHSQSHTHTFLVSRTTV